MAAIPLHSLSNEQDVSAASSTNGGVAGVLVLYDSMDGAPFQVDNFHQYEMNNDLMHASFALTNTLISDQRNVQLNKSRRAREFQSRMGDQLQSIDGIGGSADLFADMLRTHSVWVYLLQKNYNFANGIEQFELRRQMPSTRLKAGGAGGAGEIGGARGTGA